LHYRPIMLRLDRYLVARDHTRDLATGATVSLRAVRRRQGDIALFRTRNGRTLIDLESTAGGCIEVWEEWTAGAMPVALVTILVDFIELLDCARHGAPRALDLPVFSTRQDAFIRRALAREARLRGWLPAALDTLTSMRVAAGKRLPPWLRDRSLVLFLDVAHFSKDSALTLLHIAGLDARPHILVRTLPPDGPCGFPLDVASVPRIVHETAEPFGTPVERSADGTLPADAEAEATARWQRLLLEHGQHDGTSETTVRLADVLASRQQGFEARALLEPLTAPSSPCREQVDAILTNINRRATARIGEECAMVDDVVDMLQLCADVEDEQTALAKLGALVRDRLQASSVAFLVREGAVPRVLTRIGSTAAGVELACKAIETGVAMAPSRNQGPVEAACPVRHASEVIGALWCRWSAGMPVAPRQATTLLGVAAAAAAPSVRLMLARVAPPTRDSAVPELVGESAVMVKVREAIVRAAASPFPVLIEGESGSGKELAARAIHARSSRRDRRFCAINCAALVDDLFEAELFGHTRGAFTGAHADRPGLFEDASGGTLFMDEIAELGARVQAKLLRVLQEGEVRRLGETSVRKVDARIVAATNRALAAAVDAGSFRADLWYRLDVVRITLPPLRDRIEDVPLLAAHLWQALAARTGSRAALSPATVAALSAYTWPGNIRELQNVLASLLVAAPRTGLLGPSSLPAHIARVAALDKGGTLADARKRFDERYVRAALARAGGRTPAAAKELGLSRQGLAKLMGRLGIPQPTIRSI
jgi:DNA-binding NtrC family response regulator